MQNLLQCVHSHQKKKRKRSMSEDEDNCSKNINKSLNNSSANTKPKANTAKPDTSHVGSNDSKNGITKLGENRYFYGVRSGTNRR